MKFRIQNYPNYTIEDDANHTVYGPRGVIKVVDGKVQIKIDGTPKRVKVSDLWSLREDDFNIADKPAAAENVLSNHAYIEQRLTQFEAETQSWNDKTLITSLRQGIEIWKGYANRGMTYSAALTDWKENFDSTKLSINDRLKIAYRMAAQRFVGDEYSGGTNISALKRYAEWLETRSKIEAEWIATCNEIEAEFPKQLTAKYGVHSYDEYLDTLNKGVF